MLPQTLEQNVTAVLDNRPRCFADSVIASPRTAQNNAMWEVMMEIKRGNGTVMKIARTQIRNGRFVKQRIWRDVMEKFGNKESFNEDNEKRKYNYNDARSG